MGIIELIKVIGKKEGWKTPQVMGLFRCYCGKEFESSLHHVTSGHTTSCGCRRTESVRAKVVTHDKSKLPIYKVWLVMKQRCTNPKCKEYKWYGARGIKMCERWNDFQLFYDDIGINYRHGLQIDRIDGDGDYEPGNCRLVTSKENNRNKKQNRIVSYNGTNVGVSELAEMLEVQVQTLLYRLNNWSFDDAVTKPIRPTGSRSKSKLLYDDLQKVR